MNHILTCPVTGDDVVDILATMNPDLINQKCLDHGFVKVLDCMPRLIPMANAGGDFALADAARISYQKGTRKVSADTGLIDHLIRNQHTSPIEMAELKFHIRLPIFVMRQHVRHRTASLNEESARYSELASDFYVPDAKDWAVNISTNKQATDKAMLTQQQAQALHEWLDSHNDNSYALYKGLLEGTEEDSSWSFNIPGIAREQARMVLGVNIYTQCVWKCDLKNLLHYLKLRTDPHAQYEIRVFADAIARVVEALFPAAWASFKDNFIDGVNFSKTELNLVQLIAHDCVLAVSDTFRKINWSKSRFTEFSKKAIKSGLVEPEDINEIQNKFYPNI